MKKTVVRRVNLACGAIRALVRIPRSPGKVKGYRGGTLDMYSLGEYNIR